MNFRDFFFSIFIGLVFLTTQVASDGSDVNHFTLRFSFNLTEEGKNKLKYCNHSIQVSCNEQSLYESSLGMSMIDPERKILMEISPKAHCSGAATTFLQALGFERERDYTGWVHDLREIYHDQCAQASPCHYLDEEWFRFKVVRNPFARVVSGYLFAPRWEMMAAHVPTLISSGNATFEQFIDILGNLSISELQHYGMEHANLQSQPYERYVNLNNLKPIFHEIVKAEDSKASLDRIYALKQVRYNLTFSSYHFQEKKKLKRYVGNIPWYKLHKNAPNDYGWFYNEATKAKVERIFHWDLVLYNYTFPFQMHWKY